MRQKWANIPHFRHINGKIGTMVVLIPASDSFSFELIELFSVTLTGEPMECGAKFSAVLTGRETLWFVQLFPVGIPQSLYP